MSTATLERPTDVDAPDKERLTHLLRVPGTPFPAPALCGHICTRYAPAGLLMCGECEAIYQRAR